MQAPETPTAAPSVVVPVDPRAELAGVVDHMAALAREGDWPRVARLASGLDALIGRLPDGGRDDALARARAGIERISALAVSARRETGEKLKALRHGRDATARYRDAAR